jgi:hypothetical protein
MNISQWKAQGRELEQRLADFKDFGNDEAYNALRAEYKAWEAAERSDNNANHPEDGHRSRWLGFHQWRTNEYHD